MARNLRGPGPRRVSLFFPDFPPPHGVHLRLVFFFFFFFSQAQGPQKIFVSRPSYLPPRPVLLYSLFNLRNTDLLIPPPLPPLRM